jgi:hypothetical protein
MRRIQQQRSGEDRRYSIPMTYQKVRSCLYYLYFIDSFSLPRYPIARVTSS